MTNDCKPVEVSRRIEAPAARVFEILADPRRHVEFDGSDMLRGSLSKDRITGVGDIFSMKMYFEPLGDYVMLNHVVEYEPDRRLGWEPAPGDPASAQDGDFTVGVPAGHRWSYRLTPDGSNATVVTEIYDCAAAPEQLRQAVSNGETWIDSMEASLVQLDVLCRESRDQEDG
ncbi:MAG: hypothetical protein ACLP6E_10300 [Acidimicrobiales bacterium]